MEYTQRFVGGLALLAATLAGVSASGASAIDRAPGEWRSTASVAIGTKPDLPLGVTGLGAAGGIETVRVVPEASAALNLAFDVTPARLVTALITERGACPATRPGLRHLYSDLRGLQ